MNHQTAIIAQYIADTDQWRVYDEMTGEVQVGQAGKSLWLTMNYAIAQWGMDWEEFQTTRYVVRPRTYTGGMQMKVQIELSPRLFAHLLEVWSERNDKADNRRIAGTDTKQDRIDMDVMEELLDAHGLSHYSRDPLIVAAMHDKR